MERMHKHIAKDKICVYCSMNKQYIKGVQKRKMAYCRLMDNKMVTSMLALLWNGKTRNNNPRATTKTRLFSKEDNYLLTPYIPFKGTTDTLILRGRQLFIDSQHTFQVYNGQYVITITTKYIDKI